MTPALFSIGALTLSVLTGGAALGQEASSQPPPRASAIQGAPITPPEPLPAVERRENLMRTLDEDGDGFVDRAEAESFYARRFEALDDNGDERLSRAELEPELAGEPDPEAVFAELDVDLDLGIDRGEYFEADFLHFQHESKSAVGMMSTTDFRESVRFKDPLLSDDPELPEPEPPGGAD